MKVLLATFTYPPNADGVAEASAMLARGLAARGHEVQVATEFRAGRTREAAANPRITEFNITGSNLYRGGVQGDVEGYRRFLREADADILIFECWDMWPMHASLPVLGQLRAAKVLVSHGYTAHIWSPYPRFPWGIGGWVRGLPAVLRTPWTLRAFDQLVVLSQRAGFDRFLDHWMAKVTGYRACSVIPNGARAGDFAEDGTQFREAHGIGPGPLVLCVANYSDRKNQKLALRAFRRAAISEATLVFIGSEFNQYSNDLMRLDRELAGAQPGGSVLFLERVSRKLTCSAFCAADLFVLSARQETQPIVLLEAMASRTAWVSTDTGCVADLKGGVVVRSERALAQQIGRLVRDPAARQSLAEAGWRACRETYDWERVVDAYEQLLVRLARAKQKG